jgi:hypothetical protein
MEYFLCSHFKQALMDLCQIWNIILINCEHNEVLFVSIDKEDTNWTSERFNGLGNTQINRIEIRFDEASLFTLLCNVFNCRNTRIILISKDQEQVIVGIGS